jgi:hypothetical protein
MIQREVRYVGLGTGYRLRVLLVQYVRGDTVDPADQHARNFGTYEHRYGGDPGAVSQGDIQLTNG